MAVNLCPRCGRNVSFIEGWRYRCNNADCRHEYDLDPKLRLRRRR